MKRMSEKSLFVILEVIVFTIIIVNSVISQKQW